MNHLILAADSRGVGLETFINSHAMSKDHEIHHIIMPGGKINTISSAIHKTINTIKSKNVHVQQNINVVMMAGICNFTEKFHHENGTEVKYIRDENNLQAIKLEVSQLYCNMKKNNVQFKIAHIAPASLTKYTLFNIQKRKLKAQFYSVTDKLIQQQKLEEDITIINTHISSLNQQFNKCSLRWDRDLILCKSKKRGRNGKIKKKKSNNQL